MPWNLILSCVTVTACVTGLVSAIWNVVRTYRAQRKLIGMIQDHNEMKESLLSAYHEYLSAKDEAGKLESEAKMITVSRRELPTVISQLPDNDREAIQAGFDQRSSHGQLNYIRRILDLTEQQAIETAAGG